MAVLTISDEREIHWAASSGLFRYVCETIIELGCSEELKCVLEPASVFRDLDLYELPTNLQTEFHKYLVVLIKNSDEQGFWLSQGVERQRFGMVRLKDLLSKVEQR